MAFGGGGSSSNPQILMEIQDKGVLTVLEEEFPRVMEIGSIDNDSKLALTLLWIGNIQDRNLAVESKSA